MKKSLVAILLITICGCSYHNIGKESIKKPSKITKSGSTFLLVCLTKPVYIYSDSLPVVEMPKIWFDNDFIAVLSVSVIDVFQTKDSLIPNMDDSLKEYLFQNINRTKGLSKDQIIKIAIERYMKYKTIYVAIKKKSDIKMLNRLHENRKTFLLRSDYSYLSTDTTMFSESLYISRKRYFKNYLEKYHW